MNSPASLCNPHKSPVPILTSCPSLQRGSFLNQGPMLRPRRSISMKLKSDDFPHLPEMPFLPKLPLPHLTNSTLAAAIRNVKHGLEEVVDFLDKTEKFLDPLEIIDEGKQEIKKKADEVIHKISDLAHLPKNGITDAVSNEIHKGEKAVADIIESATEKLHLDPKNNPLSDVAGKAIEEAGKVEKAIENLNPFKHH